MKKILIFLILCLAHSLVFAQNQKEGFGYNAGGKRDPFIAIVDLKGLRPKEELFGRPKIIDASDEIIFESIKVNAILWDKNKPLVVINGKVFKEGQIILNNVKLEQINKDHIIVSINEQKAKIKMGGQKDAGQK